MPSSYKYNEWCYAIAFNQFATTMIAGCDNLIKVFQFEDGKLREDQQLYGHSNYVKCLQFMKKSSQFISASDDQKIVVWEQNQNNVWEIIQVLKGHKSYIWCITVNKFEDMLISGSFDKTIKFWLKQNNTWTLNQSIDCQSDVNSISLNDLGDKLIASVDDYQILVIKLQGEVWIIKQKICVQQYGQRLCFINQNQFVFQPFDRQHLLIYDYDRKEQVFKIGQELQYLDKTQDNYFLFPIRYISQIGLIMVKNDYNIHLIKRSQNSQFTVEQSINFGTNELSSAISENRKYFVTWDKKSEELQIRKFDY